MKAILMSIRPEWVAKILNGEKTIEIRKRFPKDYVGWVYIYCTKENDLFKSYIRMGYYTTRSTADDLEYNGKGKVVARFWCDKVEEITTRQDRFKEFMFYETSLDMKDLLKQSCLDYNELDDYLYGENGYAIHITKLEIFDKSKELWQFKTPKNAEKFKRDLDKAYEDDYEIGTRIAEGISTDDFRQRCYTSRFSSRTIFFCFS